MRIMNKKVALITGSSRGIGEEIALLLAENNYHVIINCKTSAAELNAVAAKIESLPGATWESYLADVGDPAAVKEMFTQIKKRHQKVDLLVNNAGISHLGLLSEMTDEEWDTLLRTNLSSVFYCCREVIPQMVHSKAGRILNISSIWGLVGASCEVAYSASKAGVDGLTKALAKELAPCNIQVNALSLGVIETKMNATFNEEERQVLMDEIPSGRFGTSKEAAQMAYHILTSPTYLTGQVINMDGGLL